MNKRLLVVIFIILLLVASTAGCFGDDKKKKSGGGELVEASGSLNSTSGWLNSQDQNGRDDDRIYVILNSEIQLFLNDTSIISISITLNFQDYDSDHQDTDGNSPEDEVEVTVEGYDVSGAGTTPCMIMLDLKSNETDGIVDYLPSELTLQVTGRCFCEITYPPTGRPSLINLYTRDQGVAYDVAAEYEYHTYT
jgi:hypothetical protein